MKPIFKPQTEWLPPESFPDLSDYSEIAIDLETKDPELQKKKARIEQQRGRNVKNHEATKQYWEEEALVVSPVE